jgi:type I restriction enzyme S subunit
MIDKQTYKYTPTLRFPEFQGKGEWEVKRLGEIAFTYSGGTPAISHKEYYGGDIPFIRSGEISEYQTELYLTQLGLDNSSAKMVNKNTILYALYGATSGEVAMSKIEGAINQAILAIVVNKDVCDALYLYYYLKSQKNHIVEKYLQGGQGNLSSAIINNLSIPIPTLSEQNRIAHSLFELDEIIEASNEKLKLLEAHKKGLMHQLFP